MRFLWSRSRELLDFIPKGLKADHWIIVVKRRPWLYKPLLVLLYLTMFLVVTAIITTAAGWWYVYKYDRCFLNLGCLTDDTGQPLNLEKIAKSDFKKASYIYANNGEEIGKYFDEIRNPVRLEEVPKRLQDAFIAAEDKRFYEHSGIDVQAIVSALIGNTTHELGFKFWARSGGASTITQQLARLLLPTRWLISETEPTHTAEN